MKGSLIALCVFALGIVIGHIGFIPPTVDMGTVTNVCLYVLIALIGVLLGSNKRLAEILRNISATTLFLPVATITGTLAGCCGLYILWPTSWTLPEYLALGSGFGYYSLSSVIIIDLKQSSIGIDLATQLGALAVLSNIMREMVALIGAPLIVRWFGPYAAISTAGVTSMDVTLPVLTRYCGDNAVPAALFHGVTLEICVPLMVTFFCLL